MRIKNILLLFIATCLLSSCSSPPALNVPSTPPPAVKLKKQPRVALVLGGGGALGFAHIGILQTLQKAGVPVDLVVGTSAGSVMGSVYADSGNVNQLLMMMKTAKLSDFIDMQNLFGRGGYMKGYDFEKYLIKNMHATNFKQMKLKFIAMTTDLHSGKQYPIESGPIAPAVLASAAIPGLVVPVKLYGHTLVDGGMANPVAVNIAKRFHPKVIIAVNLMNTVPPMKSYSSSALEKRAFTISQINLANLRSKGADIVIDPKVSHFGFLDVADKYKIYHAGVAAAKKNLAKILALLRRKHIKTK